MDTTHTGSLVNAVVGGSRQPAPEVGMGATVLHWTDRSAATVVSVSASGKSIVVQMDNARRTDSNGMSESQTWEHTPNPNAHRLEYTHRKNGAWVRKGEPMKSGGRLALGYRDTYHDFSF